MLERKENYHYINAHITNAKYFQVGYIKRNCHVNYKLLMSHKGTIISTHHVINALPYLILNFIFFYT
jgi:hypothetical protein